MLLKFLKSKHFLLIIALLLFIFLLYKLYLQYLRHPLPVLVTKNGTIKQGQNLIDILSEYDISQNEVFGIIKTFANIYNTKYMKESTEYEITLTTSGQFRKFSYFPFPDEEYTVRISTSVTAKYISEVHKYPLDKTIIITSGTVKNSLYESMTNASLAPDIVMHFAEIFESKIDFFTETMPNDIFRMKVELYTLNGKIIKHGEILSAEYEGKSARESAVLYEYAPNNRDYFNLNGESLKRAFSKAPLSYRRISSYFTLNRFHPILKRVRPHLGIDYAAPKGTPVSTIGDGIITFAGRNGGFGNQIKIKHPNGYESWYAHLSRLARNMRRGKKVFIGDVIGYVGSTGLSTGPHLDFRLKSGRKFVNFLKIKLPSKKVIPKNKLSDFKSYAKYELDLLNNSSRK